MKFHENFSIESESSNMKFNENLSIESEVAPCGQAGGQTDRHNVADICI